MGLEQIESLLLYWGAVCLLCAIMLAVGEYFKSWWEDEDGKR